MWLMNAYWQYQSNQYWHCYTSSELNEDYWKRFDKADALFKHCNSVTAASNHTCWYLVNSIKHALESPKYWDANWCKIWCKCCGFIFQERDVNERPWLVGSPNSIMLWLAWIIPCHGIVSRVEMPSNRIAISPLSFENASMNWCLVRLFILMSE